MPSKNNEIIAEYELRLKKSKNDYERAKILSQERSMDYMLADLDPDENFTHRNIYTRYIGMETANAASASAKTALWEMQLQINGINQVCGLILQSAKQSISTIHGGTAWHIGRTIGSQPLGEIIRQARNQTSHFEEGEPRTGVLNCFGSLTTDLGITFEQTKNMARIVVFDVLKRKTYTEYETDMGLNKKHINRNR